MRLFLNIIFLLVSLNSFGHDASVSYNPTPTDLHMADGIARETAAWFHYTTGKMASDHLGQCGDYAVNASSGLINRQNFNFELLKV